MIWSEATQSDILLLELKTLLRVNTKLKVILMSATLEQNIVDYFGQPPHIEIAGLTFPIDDFYLVSPKGAFFEPFTDTTVGGHCQKAGLSI